MLQWKVGHVRSITQRALGYTIAQEKEEKLCSEKRKNKTKKKRTSNDDGGENVLWPRRLKNVNKRHFLSTAPGPEPQKHTVFILFFTQLSFTKLIPASAATSGKSAAPQTAVLWNSWAEEVGLAGKRSTWWRPHGLEKWVPRGVRLLAKLCFSFEGPWASACRMVVLRQKFSTRAGTVVGKLSLPLVGDGGGSKVSAGCGSGKCCEKGLSWEG